MSRPIPTFVRFALLATLASQPLLAADQPSAAENKMRESLRATMMQLRTVETEKATLQAAQAESEQKITALTNQVDTMTKQMADAKESSEKAAADAKTAIETKDAEIARLNESLTQWKAAHQKAVTFATNTEAQRAKLAANVIVLNRRVADQQTKNAEMYRLGTEILKRYEKFGLGEALTAREPFIGTTRVKFENLIQDYSDKVADQRIKGEANEKVPAEKPAAAPEKTSKTKAAPAVTPESKPKS